MPENPTVTLNVLGNFCAKITFKHLYLSNHSELVTGTYELSFLTTTNTITTRNAELPLNHLWFGLFVHPFSHICNTAHVNYKSQFTTQTIIYGHPHNTT